jgi:3-hydroxymyristoyl/3-hydroxydecanoyl-(acyl carrier protein) dehydratase
VGHFEGLPILPGIAHLAMVVTAYARSQGRTVSLAAAREVRFKRPLGPGDEVEIALAEGGEPSSVRFEIRCDGELASRGLLLFEPPADDASR